MRIKLIGVGGIGTCLLTFLPRYLAHSREERVELFLIDGDSFEARNLDRQAFTDQGNKAQVKAQELRQLFTSLTTVSVPQFVTHDNVAKLIMGDDVVLLCVDNHATRRLVSSRCKRLANIVLISGGNDLETGNVQVYIRRKGREQTNPIDHYHPEIRYPKDTNPGEDPSCLERVADGEPQLLIANMAAALGMASAFYQVLEGRQPAEETYFDIGTCTFKPVERRLRES
jgi:molybdopterin/thiamine biosynthesis adenylyltransferase